MRMAPPTAENAGAYCASWHARKAAKAASVPSSGTMTLFPSP